MVMSCSAALNSPMVAWSNTFTLNVLRSQYAVIQAKAAQDLKNLDGILEAWVRLGSTFRATSKLITNDGCPPTARW